MRSLIEFKDPVVDTIANAVMVGLFAIGTAALIVAEGVGSVLA